MWGTPCMRLPMSLVPPVVCDMLSETSLAERNDRTGSMCRMRVNSTIACSPAGRHPASASNFPHISEGWKRPEKRPRRGRSRCPPSRSRARPPSRTARADRQRARGLDQVGGVADDTRDQHLAVRQLTSPTPSIHARGARSPPRHVAPACTCSTRSTISLAGRRCVRAVPAAPAECIGCVPRGRPRGRRLIASTNAPARLAVVRKLAAAEEWS